MLTIEEIQNMSPEQIKKTNAQLGKAVLKRFFAIFLFKWAIIAALNYYWVKSLEPKNKP